MTNQLGSFIVDIDGQTLSAEDKEILGHPLVGGVIFFARNYESRQQIQALTTDIRRTRKAPLIIMVDQEGGRVQRFIHDFTRLPRMGVFGQLYDSNPDNACAMAKNCGWLMATEVMSVGVDMSLAPVLDLNNSISTVIADRAFHADPQVVIRLASAFIQGMREAGMAATGKHYPGHGSQQVDSHHAIPEDTRSLDAILAQDLLTFAHFARTDIPALMAAHIVFPHIDRLPVGFSRVWLQDILRIKLGYKGVIFSDDLNMEGANISSHYGDRMLAAREAGCDFVMLCNNRRGVVQVLDNVNHASHMIDKTKWGVLQARQPNSAFQDLPLWQQSRRGIEALMTTK